GPQSTRLPALVLERMLDEREVRERVALGLQTDDAIRSRAQPRNPQDPIVELIVGGVQHEALRF
ncbi:hypothetical protein, partial [Achromobacter xylosoxidans]|uniref:hypothetical protein n=1 Tax=Alcaligenes xylosoxydans xylosoxydans TaxID=85698 RepID=UPI001F140129